MMQIRLLPRSTLRVMPRPAAPSGRDGWTPVLSIVEDGFRLVMRVRGWVGGAGDQPVAGQYIGSSGYVESIADAVDVKGVGQKGWSPVLATVSDGERRVLQVYDWAGGQGERPLAGQYIGALGLVSDIILAIDIRGPVGPQGIQGDKGDTGPQGIQGDKGNTGPQGEKGDKGDAGPQGIKGDTGAQGEQIPAGMIGPFAGAAAPSGYLKCNGAAVSRAVYAALFAAIGIRYGTGDGSTTFNLPDLRGEFIRGLDDGRGIDSGRALGTLQEDDFKSHDHAGSLSPAPDHIHSAWTDTQGWHDHWVIGRREGGGYGLTVTGGHQGNPMIWDGGQTTSGSGNHAHNVNRH